MARVEWDDVREERITMEIVVDTYEPEEQAMGWYCYLDDTLKFPFIATCMVKGRSSPQKEEKHVKVVAMASAEECENEMFVEVEWDGDILSWLLEELTFHSGDGELSEKMAAKTQEAMEDWHYWVNRGYEFG